MSPCGSRSPRCCPPATFSIRSAATANPDRVSFDTRIQMLVFGCGEGRSAEATCSATTVRRRCDEWLTAGVATYRHLAVLAADDRVLGLDPERLAVDGCSTEAPWAGSPPVVASWTAVSRACSAGSSPRQAIARWVGDGLAVSAAWRLPATHYLVEACCADRAADLIAAGRLGRLLGSGFLAQLAVEARWTLAVTWLVLAPAASAPSPPPANRLPAPARVRESARPSPRPRSRPTRVSKPFRR